MEPYVFISYSSQNYAQVQWIRDHLERSGLRCWMAPDSIEGGRSYASQIPQAINNCGAFLLVLDRAAMHSQWVSREVDRAINQKKRVFPFMTEQVSLTDEFQFYLNNAQYYTAYQNYGLALNQMTQEIAAHLQIPGSPSPIDPVNPFPASTPNNGKKKKGLLIGLLAAGAALLAALVLLLVLNNNSDPDPTNDPSLSGSAGSTQAQTTAPALPQTTAPESTTQTEAALTPSWKNNVLMSDIHEYSGQSDTIKEEEEAGHFRVFESEYERCQIKRVYVLDTLAEMPSDAWDVSLFGQHDVMAWVKPDGELYDLYLAAEGGICAPEDCSYLFTGYNQTISFSFGGNFHTDNVRNMHNMFAYCTELRTFNLSEFNTAQVQDMSGMFSRNLSLKTLTLDHVNTAKVTDMRAMFNCCVKLEELNLSSFSTSKVTNMGMMFYACQALVSLSFGESFTTDSAIYMDYMFELCRDLKTLDLHTFHTKNVTTMKRMFQYCDELASIQYGPDFIISDSTNTENMYFCCNKLPEEQKLVP